MSGGVGPGDYRDEVEIELLGRRVRVLELSREVSETMPVYPGHVKVAFWEHLSHEQVRRQRLPPGSPVQGYAVRGIVASEHVSTHVDAVWHFNPDRPDLTIDRLPWEHLITPAAWIDLSDVWPRTHITLDDVQRALARAEVTLEPGMTLLYTTGIGERWDDPWTFLADYPGLDEEASDVAARPGDRQPRHRRRFDRHPERHLATRTTGRTASAASSTRRWSRTSTRIPMHQGFWVGFFPLRLVGGTGSPARAIALWDVGAA